ncbi:metallophosphoesterase [Marinigracilibium pacificum]|uniref:Metallophosphoesterase n=1 Tax=Marinigracilibium pacificum TaxID=2729599 RepID=A0A848J4A5_9BACT|nr:metallophosphoesterase [Marinigracilibium pacificum]NMM50571.1 metallophosphoesterase [Marinigracilibium pacificum]
MNTILVLLIILAFMLAIDIYFFQAIKTIVADSSQVTRRVTTISYWLFSFILSAGIVYVFLMNDRHGLGRVIILVAFGTVISKIIGILFLLFDDIRRGVVWLVDNVFYRGDAKITETISKVTEEGEGISRNEFLAKSAIISSLAPIAAMGFGILSGAHDYRVRKKVITLPNLPKGFDGLRIAQISDIHSGSFFNKTAVEGGVEMLLDEKPDVVFFTGDLVNEDSNEVKDYTEIFMQVKAPLGVFSTLGNHDYGDYKRWPNEKAKAANLQKLFDAHKYMGWELLNNENRILKEGGDQLAIIGVENWGLGFKKAGDLKKALIGTEESATKLLLSHDPTHWDAEVRPMSDVDVMFAGHTHGFQLGIEIGDFRWSPAQYRYKQWADLYEENGQYLYVNRGYGYIGYPGRIGMPPEITIIELKRA